MWPPSTPDGNPLDYSVWSGVEGKACVKPHASRQELKASVEREWEKMSVDYVKKTCASMKKRLFEIILAGGKTIEK